MDSILLIAVLGLNILISIWNCYAVGTAWKDTMAMGSTFDKVLLWSGTIQSGVGFSMPILLVLSTISVSFLTSGEEPTLTPIEGQQLLEWIYSLWYLAVIFPILGSGLAIWAHSIREVYKRRDFTSIATAGWNSYAQISNTLSALENIGGVLSNVGDMFSWLADSKGDARRQLVLLVVLLVVISLVAGFMIAVALVKYFSSKSESRLEEYAKSEFAV